MKTEGPRQHPLTFQHPALPALPKKERRRITKRCLNIVMKQYGLWRWITIILVLNLATQFALRILLAPMPLNRDLVGMIVAGAAGAIPWLFLMRTWRTRLVRRALEELGGYCLQCGYDIRATPNTCPECGAPVPPSVEKSA